VKTIKKTYYAFMYELTDALAWQAIASGSGGSNERFVKFWRLSDEYRQKRDAV
jgi:hypothetical protein